jgi:Holliday junction resolvase RusA-like endonuclease
MGTPFDKLSPHVQEMIRRQDAAEAAKRRPAEPVRAEGAGVPDQPAESCQVILPWAPSINAYHRSVSIPVAGARECPCCHRKVMQDVVLLSEEGRDFIRDADRAIFQQMPPKMWGDLAVKITLHWPGARFDIDNRSKPVLDVLKPRRHRPGAKVKDQQNAWVFADDDRQVRDLRIVDGPKDSQGKVIVDITRMAGQQGVLFL